MINSNLLDKFDAFQAELNRNQSNFFNLNTIGKSKKKSIILILFTNSKCYWALLKTLLNSRKISYISSFFHDNKFSTDFREKSEIFNSFFVKQCLLIDNGSGLPSLFSLITGRRH